MQLSAQLIAEAQYQANLAELDAFMDTPDAYTMIEFRRRPGQPIGLKSEPARSGDNVMEWVPR